MDKILELIQQHGIWSVVGATVLYVVVKIAPEAFKYFRKKKEDDDTEEREERKLDSIHVVFGVDDNKDVWMYSVFKTEKEAEAYIQTIKGVIDEGIVLLSNECQFNKPIKGFEAYNPYSQKYFGTERCAIAPPHQDSVKISAEKTTPRPIFSIPIYTSSASSYERIREFMESHD